MRHPRKEVRRQRFHYTNSGYEKIGFATEHDAWKAVIRVNKLGRGRRVHAYVCKKCKKWHLGRIPKTSPYEVATLKEELGPRAWSNLWNENHGSTSRRFRVLVSRYGFLFRTVDR